MPIGIIHILTFKVQECGNNNFLTYKCCLTMNELQSKKFAYDDHVEWRNLNNNRHRIDGPAVIYKNGDKEWWVNDLLHRVDGPAIIRNDEMYRSKEWLINGNHHRTDGPAVEYTHNDGWYINEWYQDGKHHRTDGPAIESTHPEQPNEWYHHGLNVDPLLCDHKK